MSFFLLLGFYFGALFAAANWGQPFRHSKALKVLFAPGVALYAACRTLGAFFSLAPIEKVEFFAPGKPFLKVGKSKIPYLGCIFSAFFTHLPLVALFFFCTRFLALDDWAALSVPPASELKEDPALFLNYLKSIFLSLPYGDPAFWITLYVLAGVMCACDLKLTEFVGAVCVTLGGFWLAGFLSYLGLGFSFLSRGWFVAKFYAPRWWGIGSTFVMLSACLSCLLGLARLLPPVLRAAASRLAESQKGRTAEPKHAGRRSRAKARA